MPDALAKIKLIIFAEFSANGEEGVPPPKKIINFSNPMKLDVM